MGREGNFRHDIAAKSSPRAVEHLVGELADRQHGVVSRPQLLELGIGRGAILHRLELRRLRPVHRGVYAVGRGGLSRSGFWMAAVLACGPCASLSHRSGAALWSIRRGRSGWIEVTAPRRLGGRKGIRAYRASLPPDEITQVQGIPVTTAARTLLDLAAVVDRHELRRALEQAEVLRLGDITSLDALLSRYPGRRGTAAMRAILQAELKGERVTRSELEERFLAFARDRGLPIPASNVGLALNDGWIEADCVWRDARVVVELDGFAFHSTREAFRRDRHRDRRLRLAGWEPVRVTWWDLDQAPDQLEAELAALLALTTARRATP
jgi:hypothetical protein